jgi:hypothetical protein
MARVSSWKGIFRVYACLAALLGGARAAAAAPAALELEWHAPEDACPTQTDLMRQVAELVERRPTSRPVRAVANVERVADDRYRVRLVTESEGAQGTRVLEERSCRALGDVVVLILAWMIQPERSNDDPRQAARDAPSPSSAPPRRAARARTPSPPSSVWVLSLRGVGDLGSLPKPALGGLFAVGYRAGRLQLSLQGSYFPQSRGEVASVPGFSATGGDFSLAALGLHGCFEPTPAHVALCAGPELGYERGVGFGVSSPAAGGKAWLSLAGGLRSALRLSGRLWLEAAAEAVVPTAREQFVLDAVGVVHSPSPVSGRASLGLGLTL